MLERVAYPSGWRRLRETGSLLERTATLLHESEQGSETTATTFRDVYVSVLALSEVTSHCFEQCSATETQGVLWGFVPPGASSRAVVVWDATPACAPPGTVPVPVSPARDAQLPENRSQLLTPGIALNAVGWYRSHHGYGCWLSRSELASHGAVQESGQGPWVILIVDPVRSRRVGQVALRAFRVYPQGYRPFPRSRPSVQVRHERVPLDYLLEFEQGAPAYYELTVHYFGMPADASMLSWIKQRDWPCILSTSQTVATRASTVQALSDAVAKTEAFEVALRQMLCSRRHAAAAGTMQRLRSRSAASCSAHASTGGDEFASEANAQRTQQATAGTSAVNMSFSPPPAPSSASRRPPPSPNHRVRRMQRLSDQEHPQTCAVVDENVRNAAERVRCLLADTRDLQADDARILLRDIVKEYLFPLMD
ncbi:similar to COP9 signalosome subunit Csn5 [Cyanidioschyzon merolae strain 10D]|uniref:Similar to COP9 signalosome subunit Csn5 n=1 Tax=Cyanidioschyzon merolae (strain NIES-3377 / 10D) TaxID=280699 RepID=M1UTP7_CYAM1|nr:similar to COP9 signalosome subunit Csn5 [Cyanidioschyzon merolae strain 10D]BAM81191.1 similar to COP9 signalosome subunit Csn5 [Cyanidioschyzon merolae strain 10D]|eukprot:XP_005537227.1 similar to COP9 signalosome subunit Csn5 [Cyanidioschyzon merolae strain 10D]